MQHIVRVEVAFMIWVDDRLDKDAAAGPVAAEFVSNIIRAGVSLNHSATRNAPTFVGINQEPVSSWVVVS
jgi:hypothetical protein